MQYDTQQPLAGDERVKPVQHARAPVVRAERDKLEAELKAEHDEETRNQIAGASATCDS